MRSGTLSQGVFFASCAYLLARTVFYLCHAVWLLLTHRWSTFLAPPASIWRRFVVDLVSVLPFELLTTPEVNLISSEQLDTSNPAMLKFIR